MKKISLAVLGMYIGILGSFSQTGKTDSANYKSRKLKLEEVNIVSSYYHQEGEHAAATGGIGSEKLTDIANTIELKLYHYDKKYRKRTLSLEAGIDYYTSASSDKIDPKTISSASASDIRIYPSVNYSIENEQKGTTWGLNASFSKEFDYVSRGAGISFSKLSKDKNRELTLKANAYLDRVSLILPVELRPAGSPRGDDNNYATTARNSYDASVTLSQVMTQKFQLSLMAELAFQKGFLSMPFNRVYFSNNTTGTEALPGSRLKVPIGLRANYFLGDRVILRSYYRYYQDDWGIKAHTISLETTVKLNPFVSLSPFYRYYTQTAIDYFAPYKTNAAASQYHSSDYDLSAFHSGFMGMGVRLAPEKGVFGMKKFSMLELRYGHYNRSNALQSDVVTLNIKLK